METKETISGIDELIYNLEKELSALKREIQSLKTKKQTGDPASEYEDKMNITNIAIIIYENTIDRAKKISKQHECDITISIKSMIESIKFF